jgi:hypothetical protein
MLPHITFYFWYIGQVLLSERINLVYRTKICMRFRSGKNYISKVIYDLQATNRREGGDTSCRGRSREAPGLHLERARDRAGGSRTAWRAN